MRIKVKLGQSILGFTFAFIILAALSIGLTRIWAWYNINFGSRQVRYQESRQSAGSPGFYGPIGNETAYITSAYNPNYKPVNLTEQWVFKGEPTETTPYTMPDFGSLVDAATACRTACPACVTCVPDPDNPPQQICSVDVECECYTRCMCRERVNPQISMYNQQIAALRDARDSMYREAQNLDDKAEECDDPWELCWWGGFGVPSKKLREAARSLRQQANKLCCGPTSQAGMIAAIRDSILNCCNAPANNTAEKQALCLECVTAGQCPNIRAGYNAEWQDIINELSCERSFANNIRTTIDNKYGRPAPDNGCQHWADYQCRYGCEIPEVAVCEQEIRDGCNTDCLPYCTAEATCGPPEPPGCDPPVFDPVRYANCVADECIDNGNARIDTWYEQCVSDRMTDPANPLSYNACIARRIIPCVTACPGSAEWDRLYEECCMSFCCNAPTPPCGSSCNFGVFDHRYNGYRLSSARRWAGGVWTCTRNCQCCDTAWAEGCSWVTPGRIGDRCLTTWQARYPEWRNNAAFESFCGEREAQQDRWWGRGCRAPSTNCDEDCENVAPPPAACIVPVDYFHPTGLAMCGLEELGNRQVGVIAGYDAEIAKFRRKQNYIAGCCNNLSAAPTACAAAAPAGCLALPAGCINWVLDPDPDRSPLGTCSVRDEAGNWVANPDEVTEFGCMSICIQNAVGLGEAATPGSSLEEICPNCFSPPLPADLPPDQFETCIRDCTGTTSDCCVQECLDPANGVRPENYNSCIQNCKAVGAYGCPPSP